MQNNIMSELKVLQKPLKIMEGHIGFIKGKHGEVIDRLNKVLTKMNQNGEIESIINKYIENNL